VWASRTLLDTDRYTETVAPLAQNAAIRDSVAVTAVDNIFAKTNAETEIRDALPPKAAFLAPQLSSSLRTYGIQIAEKALATQQFQTLWTEANRRAHARIVPALLSGTGGRGGNVSVSQGTLTLDMTGVVADVKAALAARGLTFVNRVPDTAAGGDVTLFQSAQLGQLQSALRTLQTLSVALPVLSLLAFVGAIAAAPDRRRALLWVGVTAILAMIAIAAVLALARDAYVSSPPLGILSGTAAVAFFDTLIRFLQNAVRTVAVLGLVLLIGAALAGPSRAATGLRHAVSGGFSSLGLDLGGASLWFERHRRSIDISLVVLAAVVLFAVSTPTPGLVIGLGIAVLVGILIVELLAHAHPAGPGAYRGQPGM
jgi:hypothetical protein